jgi:pilus assembly protein CpaF
VLMAGMQLPINAIRQQVVGAIDIIIQQSRMRDGSRKIVSISEVTGMEADTIVMQEIFKYDKLAGRFIAAGLRPHCCDQLIANTIPINDNWFTDEDKE